MKISVVIPTYNRPELLIKCLKQLSEQDFSKAFYEVIVVTDGPDIETCSVMNLLSEQEIFFNMFCYSLDEKKGPAAARNKGAEKAKGELIVFTDDDCLPQQDWLKNYWNFYQSINNATAAFTGKTIVPHSDTPTDYEKNILNLESAEFITANCAITKTAFTKVGGFDEDFPIAWREDSDMHFKLIEASVSIYSVKNAIVIHPVRKANWGVSLKEQKKGIFNALLYKKHPGLYKEKIASSFLWTYYAMVFLFLFSIISFILNLGFAGALFFTAWSVLLINFIFRRLENTSKSIPHIAEMIITSAIIPFLSVFWNLYGVFKYKTLTL